jgi:ferredoxin
LKISIERDSCISTGACVLEAPGLFDQDDEGFVVLLTDSPSTDDEEPARNAMLACPASVISVTEVE